MCNKLGKKKKNCLNINKYASLKGKSYFANLSNERFFLDRKSKLTDNSRRLFHSGKLDRYWFRTINGLSKSVPPYVQPLYGKGWRRLNAI